MNEHLEQWIVDIFRASALYFGIACAQVILVLQGQPSHSHYLYYFLLRGSSTCSEMTSRAGSKNRELDDETMGCQPSLSKNNVAASRNNDCQARELMPLARKSSRNSGIGGVGAERRN